MKCLRPLWKRKEIRRSKRKNQNPKRLQHLQSLRILSRLPSQMRHLVINLVPRNLGEKGQDNKMVAVPSRDSMSRPPERPAVRTDQRAASGVVAPDSNGAASARGRPPAETTPRLARLAKAAAVDSAVVVVVAAAKVEVADAAASAKVAEASARDAAASVAVVEAAALVGHAPNRPALRMPPAVRTVRLLRRAADSAAVVVAAASVALVPTATPPLRLAAKPRLPATMKPELLLAVTRLGPAVAAVVGSVAEVAEAVAASAGLAAPSAAVVASMSGTRAPPPLE